MPRIDHRALVIHRGTPQAETKPTSSFFQRFGFFGLLSVSFAIRIIFTFSSTYGLAFVLAFTHFIIAFSPPFLFCFNLLRNHHDLSRSFLCPCLSFLVVYV